MSHLKKNNKNNSSAPVSTSGLQGSDNFRENYRSEHHPNINAPTFQRVHRGRENNSNSDEDEKICRICLEEDNPETMIAPCLCKGGSKWVHRECLDEWRTHERDRAFSKCTECQFEYHLQPVYHQDDEDENEEENRCWKRNCCLGQPHRRRCLFYWMVSRDLCMGMVLQQLVMIILGALIWAYDPARVLPELLGIDQSSPKQVALMYYGFGWFTFWVCLGLYGCVVLCRNRCNVQRSLPRLGPPSEAVVEPTNFSSNSIRNRSNYYNPLLGNDMPSYASTREYHRPQSSTSEYYRRARRRHDPMCHPVYVYPGNEDCCYCCCCDSDVGIGSGSGSDGCCGDAHGCCVNSCCENLDLDLGGGSSSDGDGQHVLLVILLVVLVALAILGFLVGVVVVVVAIQRIVGRHIYLLQKRQLVREFRVMDLQDYDLDRPLMSKPNDGGGSTGSKPSKIDPETPPNIGGTKHPPPSAPTMPADDLLYLKNLGLLDR